MRCYVLTGISRNVIEELLRRNIRTVELRSAHNVATALRAEIGDCVFLTPARVNDLGRGVSGLIAEITGKEIMSQSLFYSSPGYMEECELTVVRLRLKPKGVGRMVQVSRGDVLDTTEADVVETSYFDAR
ncbi:DUF473 domain-containing protein [Archaeoglobus neptunius]|uniref:DUF473 domain-containing protein n=1 Tax=Archaeoglobus neptunius TaxID=2798580 RepID=UPI001927FAFE|nr:DUF473 domain-containing protein [Archaeoglobus neptunius]